MIFGVYTPFVRLTSEEVHAELSALGVSAEVHALVDVLDLVPLVLDVEKMRKVKFISHLRTCRHLILDGYVRKPYHPEKEETGRLF